jgi:hypothetical protein
MRLVGILVKRWGIWVGRKRGMTRSKSDGSDGLKISRVDVSRGSEKNGRGVLTVIVDQLSVF